MEKPAEALEAFFSSSSSQPINLDEASRAISPFFAGLTCIFRFQSSENKTSPKTHTYQLESTFPRKDYNRFSFSIHGIVDTYRASDTSLRPRNLDINSFHTSIYFLPVLFVPLCTANTHSTHSTHSSHKSCPRPSTSTTQPSRSYTMPLIEARSPRMSSPETRSVKRPSKQIPCLILYTFAALRVALFPGEYGKTRQEGLGSSPSRKKNYQCPSIFKTSRPLLNRPPISQQHNQIYST